jgi:lysophospholipase L1-like esterase
MRKLFIPLVLFLMAFAMPEKKKITIWMCGDSTMSIKEKKAYPETGWGMPFVYFWDSTVTIENLAKNGRSTSSFRNEGLWQIVLDKATEGDYVFIQFGHNDEVPTKKTYTTEAEFKNNLRQYVSEARSKKATPILLTPMARRKFDANGKIEGTHDMYSQIVRDVAKEEKVISFDNSKLLFMQLKPSEHPNYPDGRDDNTHFNELGARLIAQLVLTEIRSQIPGLADRIVKPVVK